jgi:hypothetical protein
MATTNTNIKLPRVSPDEFLQAIREGVHDAFWEMITNATGMPCHDFYDAVQQGVKEAMLELGPVRPDPDAEDERPTPAAG